MEDNDTDFFITFRLTIVAHKSATRDMTNDENHQFANINILAIHFELVFMLDVGRWSYAYDELL